MATLVLGAIGTLIGGPIGGSIGALLGRSLDTRIFGGGAREGPRLTELKLTSSSYGAPIPRHFGRMRVPGQIIWATDLVEHKEKQGGSKGSPSVTSYSYTASFAVALSSRPLLSVGRIWADGKLLRGEAGDLKVGGTFRFYSGQGDQSPDPLIASAEGAGQCPAYRGLGYIVFEDLQLSEYGNRIPSLSFEVVADQGALTLSDLLDQVVSDTSAMVDLPGLAGLSIDGPLVDALGSLDPFYPIDADACDNLLTFSPDRRDLPAVALPIAATSSNSDDFGGNQGFARRRGGEPEAPIAVLRYYDLDRDYQPGAQRASGRPGSGQPRTIELPASLAAVSARGLVERAAKRANWARQTLSWRVSQLDPQVRPGTTVTVPGHPGLWRIKAWEWRDSGVDLTLVRMSPQAATDHAASDPGRTNPPPDLTLGSTSLAACELPWDGNNGTVQPLILAMASSDSAAWPGASLYVDTGDGALLPLGPTGRNRAIIGTAVNALPQASPLLFDRHNRVKVDLDGDDLLLTTATLRQLAMGANRALLGNELIQFANAEPLGAGQWRLSGLLRGRGGTEAAAAGHQIGEPFMLLDGSGIALDPAMVGTIPQAEIAAIGLGDGTPVTAQIIQRGIAFRPPSPVHARWQTLAAGTQRLSWTRRARGGWHWLDGVDAPLNEQFEAYQVTFGLPDNPYARWELAAPALNVASSELSALITAVPQGRFAIRQRGDRALSDELTIAPPQL
jgi:Putative phage tail protein